MERLQLPGHQHHPLHSPPLLHPRAGRWSVRRRRLWWWTSGPAMRAILTAEEASLAVEDEGQPAPWTCSPGGGCTRSSSPCSPTSPGWSWQCPWPAAAARGLSTCPDAWSPGPGTASTPPRWRPWWWFKQTWRNWSCGSDQCIFVINYKTFFLFMRILLKNYFLLWLTFSTNNKHTNRTSNN